ncbi:MAG: hypothetical protein PHR53_02450 [Bacteroidales bacterium]|nr:hypothetical protein [Bacteroidales bacterium]
MSTPITCSLSMEDLTKDTSLCANKMSGVKTIYYALKDDAATIPSLKTTRTTFEDFATLDGSIVMKTGKRFFKFHSEKDMGELTYKTQGTSGCKSLLANLETFHPGLRKKLLGFVDALMNQELLIIVKLNNGELHLLGDADRGAEFADDINLTSGKAVSDQNGATLNFVYATPAAQIYTGDVDDLLEPAGSGSGA